MGRTQRRCSMDSRQIGFVALSMRVLNTTPGFQDSSNPHESFRTPSDSGVKAGSGVLNGSVAEVNDAEVVASSVGAENSAKEDSCPKEVNGALVPVSNLGTMSGATDFG